MKKILLILAVLALAAPTMAAVSVSVVNNGDCTGDITYSMTGEAGDQRVRAWALTVTVDSGAVITAVDPCVAGESDAVNKGFGFFPGTIVIVGGVITDPNTPVAPNDLPGAAGTGIGIDTVILEMASLNVDSNFPPDIGTLATITVSQDCNVTITAEVQYRGGIVRENANQVIGATLPTNAPITCTGEECLVVGQVVGGVLITQAMYDEWDTQGKPDSWCYDCHSMGDINNDCLISAADLMGTDGPGGVLDGWLDAWNNAYDPDCDINNDGLISAADLMGIDGPGGVLDGWLDGWNNGCPGGCTP